MSMNGQYKLMYEEAQRQIKVLRMHLARTSGDAGTMADTNDRLTTLLCSLCRQQEQAKAKLSDEYITQFLQRCEGKPFDEIARMVREELLAVVGYADGRLDVPHEIMLSFEGFSLRLFSNPVEISETYSVQRCTYEATAKPEEAPKPAVELATTADVESFGKPN